MMTTRLWGTSTYYCRTSANAFKRFEGTVAEGCMSAFCIFQLNLRWINGRRTPSIMRTGPRKTLCLLRVALAPKSPKDRKGSLGIVTKTFEIC